MLTRDLCHNIRKAARAITLVYERLFENPHLKYTQFILLVTIKETPENNLVTLANILGMERTTVTRNICSMVNKGFVVRNREDKTLKRNEKRYMLTLLGNKVFEELKPIAEGLGKSDLDMAFFLSIEEYMRPSKFKRHCIGVEK